MLHIITALYRPQNLDKIWKSLPKEEDITWHVCKSNKTPKIENEFLSVDDRIIIYECDCLDTDGCSKRNTALDFIKEGYFCFLDDDTLFHPNMYDIYKKYDTIGFVGMICGSQLKDNGSLRLKPSKPIYGKIDTGNVLSHHSCLKKVRWDILDEFNYYKIDYIFWKKVFDFFGKKIELLNIPVSEYNKLSKKNI